MFFKKLFTQLELGIPTFIVLTILTYIYQIALKRGYYKRVNTIDNATISEKTINRIALGISAVFAILVTLATVVRLWFDVLRYANSTDFNIADPIFNLDISFYIFKLELITQINQIVIGIVVAFLIVTFIFFFNTAFNQKT